MSKTCIFLDYDGVLSDSLKEAYLIARCAYSGVSVKSPINQEEYKRFREYRPIVVNSYLYYYFFEPDGDKSDEFNKKFLAVRKELMENDTEFWKSLESPLPFLEKIKPLIEKYPQRFRILSTKNKDAIIEQLHKYGINFNTDFVFGKFEIKNLSKGEFINSLKVEDAILIDDSKENIESCKKYEKIRGYMANWGYVKNPKDGFCEEEILDIIKENL